MCDWSFYRSEDGSWHWRRRDPADAVQITLVSASFRTRHECIEDAIVNHGFRVQDSWVGRSSTTVLE